MAKVRSEKKEIVQTKTDLEAKLKIESVAVAQLSNRLADSEAMAHEVSVKSEVAKCLANKISEAEDFALAQLEVDACRIIDTQSELGMCIINKRN